MMCDFRIFRSEFGMPKVSRFYVCVYVFGKFKHGKYEQTSNS